MDPLIIIPARTGSEGIPGKNFRPLAGLSPLHRAIQCAQAVVVHAPSVTTSSMPVPVDRSSRSAMIVVTTDADSVYPPLPLMTVLHHRPSHLATNSTFMSVVVADVLRAFPGPDEQPILLVQPTQPLRTPWHLQRALNLLHTYERVVSVVEVDPAQKLYYACFVPVTGTRVERRQDGVRTYRVDGTVYGFHRRAFQEQPIFITPSTHMMILDPAESCPLDTPLDWHLAELRLQAKEPFPC